MPVIIWLGWKADVDNGQWKVHWEALASAQRYEIRVHAAEDGNRFSPVKAMELYAAAAEPIAGCTPRRQIKVRRIAAENVIDNQTRTSTKNKSKIVAAGLRA
jgi:hypothetical protein